MERLSEMRSVEVVQPLPRVFICGFMEKRFHNATLHQITQDLMPQYYVSGNCSAKRAALTGPSVKQQLSGCDLMIFLLNEFTLKDPFCLLYLQYAWELFIPIQMIRAPRMRLVIKPILNHSEQFRPTESGLESPDLYILQDVLYECYKTSIKYDRLEHLSSTTRLMKRVKDLLQNAKISSPIQSVTKSPPPIIQSPVVATKLPPIDHKVMRKRSQSLFILDRPKSSLRPESLGHNNNNNVSSNTTTMSRSSTPFSSTLDIQDPMLFQPTQYLVFPYHNKDQKPKLIRFPQDLVSNSDNNSENIFEPNNSIWGSDSSLEKEEKRAQRLQGHLEITSFPTTPTKSDVNSNL